MLKILRQIHLYIGIFISPMLLFFALTGAMQTFSLHETGRGSDYKPPMWIVTLAQLHKNQNVIVKPKKPAPPAAAAAARPDKTDKPKPDAAVAGGPRAAVAVPAQPPAPPTPPKPKSHLPMKIFFLLVALGLFTSTLTGIYMAYRFGRSKLLVTGLLLAGVVVPLVLLPF